MRRLTLSIVAMSFSLCTHLSFAGKLPGTAETTPWQALLADDENSQELLRAWRSVAGDPSLTQDDLSVSLEDMRPKYRDALFKAFLTSAKLWSGQSTWELIQGSFLPAKVATEIEIENLNIKTCTRATIPFCSSVYRRGSEGGGHLTVTVERSSHDRVIASLIHETLHHVQAEVRAYLLRTEGRTPKISVAVSEGTASIAAVLLLSGFAQHSPSQRAQDAWNRASQIERLRILDGAYGSFFRKIESIYGHVGPQKWPFTFVRLIRGQKTLIKKYKPTGK